MAHYLRTIIALFLLVAAKTASAQYKADSLLKQLPLEKRDTARVSIYNNLCSAYKEIDPDTALYYGNLALELGKKINDKKGMMLAYRRMGNSYLDMSRFQESVYCEEQSVNLARELKDKNSEASALGNLGIAYETMGGLSKSLDCFLKSLDLALEMKNTGLEAHAYYSIAIIYQDIMELDKSLSYYQRLQALAEKTKNESMLASAYGGLGSLKFNEKKYDEAIEWHKKRLAIESKNANLSALSEVINNIATAYTGKGNDDSALKYNFKALELDRRRRNPAEIGIDLNNIAGIYLGQKKYDQAIEYAGQSFEAAIKGGFLYNGVDASWELYQAYRDKGDAKKALYYCEQFTLLKDSMEKQENNKETLRKGLQFEFGRKMREDSLRAASDKAIAHAQLREEQTKGYALYGGLALVLLFSGFMYNRYKISQKQKNIIEDQKNEVEHQKHLVDEKQKEILDSIAYARRLQDAIMPAQGSIEARLPGSFVLYKPKDIVAGDFYWMQVSSEFGVESSEKENSSEFGVESSEKEKSSEFVVHSSETDESSENSKHKMFQTPISKPRILNSELIFVAAADCTGHGVPGAMVSVVCSGALNRSVREFELREPGKILDKTRELVLEAFSGAGGEVKDGMDISLCCIRPSSDPQKMNVQWAGANNPLWYISDVEEGLREIKPDKQPIGLSDAPRPFRTHSIELRKGSMIYLFTDGYADQFGGPAGKKFKYRQLEEKLVACFTKDPSEQSAFLNRAFEDWRGAVEQIDDVCIIGIRL